VWIGRVEEHQTALEFASGYLIELSLSIDNLFVFLLLFRAFGLSAKAQRRALLLGVLGAIVMRGVFIFAGIALLLRFAWIQYFFGALLLVAALRLLRGKKAGAAPAPAKWIAQWTKRWGSSPKSTFVLAVIAIELVDLVFAIDSVPAVLAISHHPFVVYTSNIFAILGLRSLYFLLAGLLDRLRFLHLGLATILGFVGTKMVLAKWVHVPVGISLGFIVLVVLAATAASLLSTTTHNASAT
jgi:tellurite resistance protein TerC